MSSERPKDQPQQIPIVTGDEMSRGRFSNSMLVTHSPEEFLIDWLHMRRIVDALSDNLRKYESRYGSVPAIDPKDRTFN
jgi:hypothetical protein